MSKVIPKEQLTAYQRWELAAFEDSGLGQRAAATPSPPTPTLRTKRSKVVLPTAEEVEELHQEAWREGYNLGQEEGRKAGLRPD
jgi:flagellar assembly protein FliH